MSPRRRVIYAEQQAVLRGEIGLVCPDCGCRHFEVARTTPQEGTIMRDRYCRNCGRRVRTTEVSVETPPLTTLPVHDLVTDPQDDLAEEPIASPPAHRRKKKKP